MIDDAGDVYYNNNEKLSFFIVIFSRKLEHMTEKFQIHTRIIIFLILCTLLLSLCATPSVVQAAERTGVVSINTYVVETKDAPSDSAGHMNNLANGKPLVILDEVTGDDGSRWYKVKYILDRNGEEVTAYIRAEYVALDGGSNSVDTGTLLGTGTINANNVNVRNAAGTSGTQVLTALNKGHKVEVYGQTTVGGAVWYYVTFTKDGASGQGWVYGAYITIAYLPGNVDGEYAQSLRNAGFPDSYIPNLVSLHEKYPGWTFEAVKTGLDWNTVIEKESKLGVNLVPTSADDAKKSTASGAYNWKTNTWTIYDGSNWVAAHPDYIAYCMDPRNFLDETNIFQFESLSYNENQTLAGVQAILKGTFMAGDVTDADGTVFNYAQAFMDIGRQYSVSPYLLASRVRQEQGAGNSSLISGTYKGYEGYFNYFNFGAYGSTKEAVIKSGLTYAKAQGWNTRYKSLQGGAEKLAKNYISRGQDTLYFQKFNVVNKADGLYSHQYMGNVTAAITEGQSVAKGCSDKSQAFVFRIPVYVNMPAAAVSFTASGNPNNYLKSLNVGGATLTPVFDANTQSYSAVVNNSISSVNVSAAAVTSKSKVSGTGSYNLAVGNNTITVTCKSQSGAERNYTITIARLSAASPEAPAGAITSDVYKIDTVISGVSPGSSISDFVSHLSPGNASVVVLDANGNENRGTVGTGNKVVVYDAGGGMGASYEVVIYGDVNGDGRIDALDMIKMNRHVLGISSLSGAYLTASDANGKNDGANALDMIIMNRHILGLATIEQKR